MKFKIDKKMAYKEVIKPLKDKYNIQLVGSISKNGFSYKDIDILLTLPRYPKADIIFKAFEKDLKKLKFEFNIDGYMKEYGILHNYSKKIGSHYIGLDVFVEEKGV